MNQDETLKRVCSDVYAETKEFVEARAHPPRLGFQVLYAPPMLEPQMLIIGYQPGGGAKTPEEAAAYGSPENWPQRSEYLTAKWPLARQLRAMFPVDLLHQSVGMNAIFIRAPDEKSYKKSGANSVRTEITSFCLQRVQRISDALRPKKILVLGHGTLRLFGVAQPDLQNSHGRTLTRVGEVFGQRAIATLHPSGARFTVEDRDAMARRVMSFT